MLAALGFCARPAEPAQVRWPVMDERPRNNHLTRDVKQDGSCPTCAALPRAAKATPGQGRPQRQTLAVAAGTVTVAGLRHVPVDIAVRSAAVWDEEFRATRGELTARKT